MDLTKVEPLAEIIFGNEKRSSLSLDIVNYTKKVLLLGSNVFTGE